MFSYVANTFGRAGAFSFVVNGNGRRYILENTSYAISVHRPDLLSLKDAITTVAKLFGSDAVAVTSYQALTAALVRHTPQLLPALWARVQSLMQQSGQAAWRVGKWLPLAVDGSRISVPRTQQNEGDSSRISTRLSRDST